MHAPRYNNGYSLIMLVQERMPEDKPKLFLCSIYDDRPETCRKYPWNHANQLFAECIFVDVEQKRLKTMEEALQHHTESEISDYCVKCGACCFYGPAACSKLKVVDSVNNESDNGDIT